MNRVRNLQRKTQDGISNLDQRFQGMDDEIENRGPSYET